MRDSESESPLRLAVWHRNLAVVELLLRAGADRTINEWGRPMGNTALGGAVWNVDAAMITVLLAAGADPDATDDYYQTVWDILWGRCRDKADPRAWDAAAAALGQAPE